MEGLAVGRIVHYVLPGGEHRAAIIVRVFDNQTQSHVMANLQVFLDGSNDTYSMPLPGGVALTQDAAPAIWWCTSVPYDEAGDKPYTWHWPERA